MTPTDKYAERARRCLIITRRLSATTEDQWTDDAPDDVVNNIARALEQAALEASVDAYFNARYGEAEATPLSASQLEWWINEKRARLAELMEEKDAK